jgi:hypothetical protein
MTAVIRTRLKQGETQADLRPILTAFWHKGRKVFVPLTGEEFDMRAGINQPDRTSLQSQGLVASTRKGIGRGLVTTYEITEAGRAVLEGGV